jgi:hypothetical protein
MRIVPYTRPCPIGMEPYRDEGGKWESGGGTEPSVPSIVS